MAKKKKATKKAATKKAATKKVATKKAATKKAAPKKAAKSTAKRKPNPAFMRALTPSEHLAAIVGGNPLPRTEVVKKLWEYIKRNNLQDRRNIHSDTKLKAIFGGKAIVNMFEMQKLISKHLK